MIYGNGDREDSPYGEDVTQARTAFIIAFLYSSEKAEAERTRRDNRTCTGAGKREAYGHGQSLAQV